LARDLVQRSDLFDATAVPVNVMPQRPRRGVVDDVE
jgi:hypothetical protein